MLQKDGSKHLAVSEKYDRTTISLHWITAGLMAVLWIIGQTADWLPDGPLNTDYWSIHVVLGFALAAVIAWRIIWRNFGGNRLPAADTGVLQRGGASDALRSLSLVAGRRRAGDH